MKILERKIQLKQRHFAMKSWSCHAKNRFNDLGRQIHWMNRKYQLMGKKLNNVSISISDSFMIKFKIGD